MAQVKKSKPKPPSKWARPAAPLAAEAIRQLLKTRMKQKILAARAKMLTKIIIDAEGGEAHGFRAAIYHRSASVSQRIVRVKEDFTLNLSRLPC